MSHAALVNTDHPDLAAELEAGAVAAFQPCSVLLPSADDRAYLCAQRLKSALSLSIYYDPATTRLRGAARTGRGQGRRLREILTSAAERATAWLAMILPRYASVCQLERIAFHPEEEATRKLLPNQRNDLLHLDTPYAGPTFGRRLLRLFVNLHATDDRVLLTSLSFANILTQYGAPVGLTSPPGWWRPVQAGVARFLRSHESADSPYDDFVNRLHVALKQHEPFQDRAPKKCWRFAPETAWLLFTDGLSHAELRGRHVLEFAFLVPPETLACLDLAPHALYQRALAAGPSLRAA